MIPSLACYELHYSICSINANRYTRAACTLTSSTFEISNRLTVSVQMTRSGRPGVRQCPPRDSLCSTRSMIIKCTTCMEVIIYLTLHAYLARAINKALIATSFICCLMLRYSLQLRQFPVLCCKH